MMNNGTFQKNYSMKTVHRAIRIMRAFNRENKRLTLTELNRITGIGKSSLQRLLSTLTVERLLQKNEQDKSYQLGLEFVFFAELVETNSNIFSFAQPVMERINEEILESVSLNIIEDFERKCILNIESKYELQALTYVGHVSPLYAGASAKVLLAHLPQEKLVRYASGITLVQITENTITSRKALFEELESIRRKGYAFSNGERIRGAISVSAPIFDPYSEIFASLSTIIPSARVEENNLEEIIDKIVKGAKEITDKL